MSSTGKLDRRRRGIGSIIGAIFVALILLSGFTFYTITADVTNHYDKTKESMSEMDWNHDREKLAIRKVEILEPNNLNITVKNEGPVQSRLIWLGIFNKTATPESQNYEALNEYIEPGEIKSLVSHFTIVDGKKYVIQLITGLGNAIISTLFPASEVSCSLTLVVAPPTVYGGNNVTALLAITLNDTEVDTVQKLVVTLDATPPDLVQLMDNSSLALSSLTRGMTAFFWWTYNATSTGTVIFNATYLQAPIGTYALSTVNILTSPGGTGEVTITGVNGSAPYNPSQWNLLGSTQYVSGSISDLASNDNNSAVFRSYYTGESADINDYVDDDTSDVDSHEDWGTHSNFNNQKAKDNNYDTLTEVNNATVQRFYPSTANQLNGTQLVSGSVANLLSNDGVYMTFRSWPSQNSSEIFGNTNTGSDYYLTENTIVGSLFTATYSGWADSITAYLQVTSSTKNVKCAIYKVSDLSLVGYTQERAISPSSPSWQTFSFTNPKPSLASGAQYILVAWSSSGNGDTYFYRQNGAPNQAYYDTIAYGSPWPNPLTVDAYGARSYCIYCTYTKPIEYTSEIEFIGTSNTQTWSGLTWTLDCSYSTSGVTTTLQLYNYQSGSYPTNGDGYNSTMIGTADVTVLQTITSSPTYFRDASGNWKLRLTGKKTTNSAFDCKIDLVQYETTSDNYELDLEEQWTVADYGQANEYLCIFSGPLSSESLSVDVWTGSWNTLTTLSSADSNTWKNISVSSYLTNSTFTIRFKDTASTEDTTPDSWNVDATLLHLWNVVDEYTTEVEFTGPSNLQTLASLLWQIGSCWDTDQVTVTIQFYDFTLGNYSTSGNGYFSYLSSATPDTDELVSQTITLSMNDFKNSTGYWQVKIKGVKSASSPFLMKADWVSFETTYSSSGSIIPYNVWQWYTISASAENGSPLPYAYVSVYANGTNVVFRNATDKASFPNPAWVRLDTTGKCQLEVKSASGSAETFVLYVVIGSVVGQKAITQEAQ